MSLDELQQVWQTQPPGRLSVDPQLILQQVRRNQQSFRATIFWRDFREVFFGLLLVPVSVYMAYTINWSSLAIGAAGLFIAGYILIDRWRHRRRTAIAAESLVASVEESLRDVEHQIWLLRNVFWWYLLPCVIACLVVLASIVPNMMPPAPAWGKWLALLAQAGFFGAVFYGVYWLNQYAVGADLEPRRNELLELREGLIHPNGDGSSRAAPGKRKNGTAAMWKVIAGVVIAAAALAFSTSISDILEYVQFDRLDDPGSAADGGVPPVAAAEVDGARIVSDILEPIRKEYKLPALAATMIKDGKVLSLGATGVRRAFDTERVRVHDRFQIGTCTEAMTALLCAILIEEGKLKWDSTVGEVFADQTGRIRPEYLGVTLEELLMHRSGLPGDRQMNRELRSEIRALNGPIIEQRRALVAIALMREPVARPGSKVIRSNIGYALAGAMCERVTKQSWEDLMQTRVFQPLGMTTAGFGPPSTGEKVDQPWGHWVRGATWTPVAPDSRINTPAVLGPADAVHCSLTDWAKFAAMQLQTGDGGKSLVSNETLHKLQTSLSGEDYVFGWTVTDRGWAHGRALMHAGTNSMWYADIWLAPKRGMAFLAATNVGTDNGFLGCNAAIVALIGMADEPEQPE